MSGEVNMDGAMGDKCYPPGKMNTLMEKLKYLVGQQVTVYMYEMKLTGMLHSVGEDYIELHVMNNNMMRMVYIPLYSIMAVTPGEPLMMEPEEEAAVIIPSTPGIL